MNWPNTNGAELAANIKKARVNNPGPMGDQKWMVGQDPRMTWVGQALNMHIPTWKVSPAIGSQCYGVALR
jgi:hypothetical protein